MRQQEKRAPVKVLDCRDVAVPQASIRERVIPTLGGDDAGMDRQKVPHCRSLTIIPAVSAENRREGRCRERRAHRQQRQTHGVKRRELSDNDRPS